MFAVFLVYATMRNFIATNESFRRLAWLGFVNGVSLAVFALGQSISA